MPQPATAKKNNRVPITVITGFLGSGKTTLIRQLTTRPEMSDTALIINEFGEVGLDNLLVETAVENTLVLENGCICCSIRGDLADTVNDLFAKSENGQIPNFSRILIETTGLAEPGPIVESIQNEPGIQNRCRLGRVVTLVDGFQGQAQLHHHKEVVLQIAQADIALISKVDVADPDTLGDLEEKIRKVNPAINIDRIEQGRVDPEVLFQYDFESRVPVSLENIEQTSGHHHHGDVDTWSLVSSQAIDREKFNSWLAMLFTLKPYAMLRMKGVINLQGDDRPMLVQAVGNIISSLEILDEWPFGQPETRFVLIFEGLSVDAVDASFHAHVM